MGMIEKLFSLVYEREPILYSGVITLPTRYGMYQIKVYRDGHYEYLAIMSTNFSDLIEPIVYIHSESHTCDPHKHQICYCGNQMEMALKMICKEGGLVIFHCQESSDIDTLLAAMKAYKPKLETGDMTESEVKPGLRTFGRVSHTLGFILKDLNLSAMRLVSDNPADADIAQQIGIEITKSASSISFWYGG
ncbi:MAG: hypothetical protein IE918_08710 [Campylobacterales bacterium]|nr:hypothetical protein [Campylobacterales bacterium]